MKNNFSGLTHLFTWAKKVSYADYCERALTNGVLSIQRGTEPGVVIYMLPQGRGVSKAKTYFGWGNKFDSFRCCYGTGAPMLCPSYFINGFKVSHYTISFLYSILKCSHFFPCLVGIESFSKLGDFIYFEEQGENPTLYIIPYISSLFNWKSGQIILNQTVVPASSWDPFLYTSVIYIFPC